MQHKKAKIWMVNCYFNVAHNGHHALTKVFLSSAALAVPTDIPQH